MTSASLRSIALSLLLLALCCCSSQQDVHSPQYLFKYVKDNQYEPFAIPRERWGAGTVVNYDEDGVENIIWFNDECLNLAPSGSDVSLVSNSYSIGTGATLELGLAKSISPKLNLSAALNDERVKDIVMSLQDPSELVVSDGAIKQKIKALAQEGNTCVDEIFLDGVYVIDRTLGLQGLNYEFKNASQTSISLDATLLNKIDIDPALQRSFQGKSSLSTDGPRMIGYRLFSYKIAGGGLMAGALESERVDPKTARKRAMNQN